ncbi:MULTISPECIES: TraL conjugative transposon family protein [Bacteroides]|uniref:Putative transmembrane protein n=1 Tax=Bacteroides uniformis TaxID=820 RepID=A0A174SDA0_BACUN|nr:MULTISPECIES: TraL conjugative transposon family protein [Bacteroides]CUP93190.1 putative transmembrane protein [Bacteroides uniformis]
MIRKKIQQWQDRFDDGLRGMCGRLTPGKQLAVTLTLLLGFSALSIYFVVSSIYNLGKREGELLQIQHIEELKLQQERDSLSVAYSKQSLDYNHGR